MLGTIALNGVRYFAADWLPDIAAFFYQRKAKGVSERESVMELQEITNSPDDDEVKRARIRSEAGLSITEAENALLRAKGYTSTGV